MNEEQTEFGKAMEAIRPSLEDFEIVEKKEMEGKEFSILNAWAATSKEYPDSRYAVIVFEDKKAFLGGSIIAKQIEDFAKAEKKYPCRARLHHEIPKKGFDYWVLQ